MDKLKTTSRRLQVMVLIFMALTPCAVALIVVTGEWSLLVEAPASFPLDETRIYGAGMAAMVASRKPSASTSNPSPLLA